MGLPKVIFTSAKSDDSNTANSYGIARYGEIYNDKVPQSGKYGTDESLPEAVRGEFTVDVFDWKELYLALQLNMQMGLQQGLHIMILYIRLVLL